MFIVRSLGARLAKRYGDRLEIKYKVAVVLLHSGVRIPYLALTFVFNTPPTQVCLMSQKQVSISKKEFAIHPYDRKIACTLKLIEKELSEYNYKIIKNYDKELVNNSLAKATRLYI